MGKINGDKANRQKKLPAEFINAQRDSILPGYVCV